MTASYKGFSDYGNATAPYVAEYNNRIRMRKLGFTDSMENLDAVTAEYFIAIAMEYSRLENEEMKEKMK